MPVVMDIRKAVLAMAEIDSEISHRYKIFTKNHVRNLEDYNALSGEDTGLDPLPAIAIFIDELLDLRDDNIPHLIDQIAQRGRAAGIHLIAASCQLPSRSILNCFPSRAFFHMSIPRTRATALGITGTEHLSSPGEFLFRPANYPCALQLRTQPLYDATIRAELYTSPYRDFVVQYDEAMIKALERKPTSAKQEESLKEDMEDPLLPQAVEAVVGEGYASTSLIQRRCKLGYARSARILDEMERL